jgi:tRNA-splicing ligase RtcB
MMRKESIKKISPVLWEIPKGCRTDMRVPARVFATEKMLDQIVSDRSLEQLINVSTLPGIVGAAYAMPDVHEGYGFPIGGVAATRFPSGAISPGGIGYDINCGVRLLKSEVTCDEIKSYFESLSREIYHWIPSGVGRGGRLKLDTKELDQVLKIGARWMREHNYAQPGDIEHIESNGCLKNADSEMVSDLAKKRGLDQLGTLGAGNHFCEVGFVDQVYDEKIAETFDFLKISLSF